MGTHFYDRNQLTVGIILVLAVIFIQACQSTAQPTAISSEPTTTAPIATATDPPATDEPPPLPTPSPLPTNPPTTEPPASPTATPAPETSTETPPPAEKPGAESGVEVYESTLILPTYPFRDFLTEQIDPTYNIPVYYFDRSAYESTPREAAPITYQTVTLENPYLRLTFLPELGGRLYSAVVKATGQEVFYHNPVVKPSRYGVLQPYEANWWLATGGMEWAYPTQEHGYRFGIPWEYTINQRPDSATITLQDTAPNRIGLSVDVTLPANSASFTVAPTLTNNSDSAVPVQLWTNAALSLSDGSMSLETRFVLPAEQFTVHSRGEPGWSVPGEREQASWPQTGETDLSRYAEWANYLGLFVPNSDAPFIGAYNPETNLGIVRLSEADPGSGKLFAFGKDFPDRSYTDDNSQYFEIWGGANAGFWPEDDIDVAAGESLGWKEQWWPLAQLGGLTWATSQVAIYLDETTLSALFAHPTTGQLQITSGSDILIDNPFSATPAAPLQWPLPATDPAAPLSIQMTDGSGDTLLRYPTN